MQQQGLIGQTYFNNNLPDIHERKCMWYCRHNITVSCLLYWLTQLLIDTIIDWHNYWLTQLLIDTIIDWHNYWLTQLLIDTTIDWHNYWLTQLLIDAIIDWHTYYSGNKAFAHCRLFVWSYAN